MWCCLYTVQGTIVIKMSEEKKQRSDQVSIYAVEKKRGGKKKKNQVGHRQAPWDGGTKMRSTSDRSSVVQETMQNSNSRHGRRGRACGLVYLDMSHVGFRLVIKSSLVPTISGGSRLTR